MQFGTFDDHLVPNFFPITYSRSFAFVRTGYFTQIEFFEKVFGQKFSALKTLPHLQEFYSQTRCDFIHDNFNDDFIFINSRVRNVALIKDKIINLKNNGNAIYSENQLIAVRIAKENVSEFINDTLLDHFVSDKIQVQVSLFAHSWEIVLDNYLTMEYQHSYFLHSKKLNDQTELYKNQIIGSGKIYVGKDVVIHPFVSFDLRKGNVILDDSVEVMSHSALSAPCYVGEKSVIKIGSKIYPNTVIGPVCKIGGELEDVVIQGYSNKQHDGFLGHAFVGEWCNLGADTNNSDLKNTYAHVDMWENGKMADTKSQFMGTIFGDHAKTGINTQLNTGTVVGFSSNIFGFGFPERFIPSFYWSADGRLIEYRLSKVKETAKIVMSRRKIEFTTAHSKLFDDIKKLSENEQTFIKKK